MGSDAPHTLMKERREERLSLSYVGEAGEVEALLLLFSREKIENPSLSGSEIYDFFEQTLKELRFDDVRGTICRSQ